MATYWEDWSGHTLNAAPSGWTATYDFPSGAQATFRVETESDPIAPAGRRLRILGPATPNTFIFSLNAVNSDPNRATVKVAFLARYTGLNHYGGATFLITGLCAVARFTATDQLLSHIRGGFWKDQASLQLIEEIPLGPSNRGWINPTLTEGAWYWFIFEANGSNIQLSVRPGNIPKGQLHILTDTTTLGSAGRVGLHAMMPDTQVFDIAAVSIATGSDDLILPSGGAMQVRHGGLIKTGQLAVRHEGVIKSDASLYARHAGLIKEST